MFGVSRGDTSRFALPFGGVVTSFKMLTAIIVGHGQQLGCVLPGVKLVNSAGAAQIGGTEAAGGHRVQSATTGPSHRSSNSQVCLPCFLGSRHSIGAV